jgi:hypothetical protein
MTAKLPDFDFRTPQNELFLKFVQKSVRFRVSQAYLFFESNFIKVEWLKNS